jgi:hypothetical protein
MRILGDGSSEPWVGIKIQCDRRGVVNCSTIFELQSGDLVYEYDRPRFGTSTTYWVECPTCRNINYLTVDA